jgi:hypothetical protein
LAPVISIVVDSRGQLAVAHTAPCSEFSACHSMDTDWYAVDGTGRVARFESAEEGAVPYQAHHEHWVELAEQFRLGSALQRFPGALAQGRRLSEVDFKTGSFRERPVEKLPHTWDGILVFRHREYLEMFLDDYHHQDRSIVGEVATQWFCLPQVMDRLDAAELVRWDRLLETGTSMEKALAGLQFEPTALYARDVLTCGFTEYWEAGVILAAMVMEGGACKRPRDSGLFEYACSFNGPYRRVGVPAEPLTADDLPEALRARVSILRLPVLFTSTEEIDPDRFAECAHYRE